MDMQMVNRVPDWVTPIAWTFLALALVSAVVIAVDVVRGRRHGSVAAEVVWVAAALYLGPAAVVLHRRHADRVGRASGSGPSAPSPAEVGLPGGGASAVAHLLGVPLVIASGVTIAGIDLWVMIIVIGVIAVALLLAHELLAARGAGRQPSLAQAAGAAVLTVLAFDIGMGGWMVVLHYNELMPPATEGSFWFLMQLGVLLGLLTGYPAARWLVERGRSVPA